MLQNRRVSEPSFPRPFWVSAVNALGRALERLGVRPFKLDPESLLEEARRETGLTDFGPDGFREGLELFCSDLERECELHPIGRFLAHQEVLTVLVNRLQVHDWIRRHPEIREQEIREPLFVTGTPRSGTSILHELLAQDPRHRALLTWETQYPCPPLGDRTPPDDPRIRRSDRRVKLWPKIVPEYQTMHEMGGDIPQECIFLTDHDFKSEHWGGSYNLPNYSLWLVETDMRPALEYHKLHLQLLQWRSAPRRWVLKAPSHLSYLPALFDVYPDARLVWTHRDPLATVSSSTSLVRALVAIRSDELPPAAELSAGIAELSAVRFAEVVAQRDAGEIPEAQICDMLYQDLMDDPGRTLARVYAHFGLELNRETRESMLAYLRAKPQGKHGRHRYTFADTGLDAGEERARFASHIARFGIPEEVRADS